MKKNIIILLQFIIILVFVLINLVTMYLKGNINKPDVKEGKLEDYQVMIDGYIPETGYVPDAKTAIKIAKAVFNTMDISDGEYIVEYDENEQMWIVQNVSILRNPSYIIISKLDGKIIRAWRTK